MTAPSDSFAFPASFAQSRLWYIDQLEPGVPLYNMQSAYHIRGPLNVTALERSINEIIRRHESLRTAFTAPEGEPLQSIVPELRVTVPVMDLTTAPDAKHDGLQALAREHLRRPFDLAHGPLLRLTLAQLAPQEHVMLLAMHHIVSDAWSLNILAHEMSVLYDAFLRGQPSPLSELTIQYADFSEWQRSMLQGQVLQDQLDFWKNQLAGAAPTLDLPTDRPRPLQPSYAGARLMHSLSPALMHSVQTLSAQQQATPFMVLLAAFAVVLQRHTGQDDIVIGTPIANRTHVDLERLIGFLINTLALRLDLSGNPSFRQLLGRVREVALNAYDHQLLPFERLVQELQPHRDVSRAPVFQVLFQLLSLPPTPLLLAGASVEPLAMESEIARLDLALTLLTESPPAQMSAQYSTDLFDHATVERLLQHYMTLLEGAVTSPDQRIGNLPLLTPAERQRTLREWSRPASQEPKEPAFIKDGCLHQLFEVPAQQTPEATALIFEGRRYTYRELDARANALAHELIRHGIGPDVPVGLFIDHRPEAVIGMLGILKAGGAYVPLNPDYPSERLAFMLRDAALRCVLTLPGTAHLLPLADMEPIDIDLDIPEPTGKDATNPVTAVTPDNLAYIIYTSGSTGVPRGVLVPHRGVCNVVAWSAATFALGPDCCVIWIASLSFDAATRQLMMALASGAAVCVPSAETILAPSVLVGLMRENSVTHVVSPPSVLGALPDAQLPALRVVNAGGEACPPELVQRWAPGRRFFNVYGPTEASIVTTMAECRPDGTKPPIGRPIANTQAYVLDRHLQPVPVGVSGDLYLAGISLARGYLNQPAVTADRFIPNPFSLEPGSRLYRTGDVARYLPNGDIDYIGRSDSQVKIRGFRVEPGETEAVLRQHPAVRDAAVVARLDRPGDVRLIAYAVLHPQRTETPAKLEEYLRQVLPYYMIPSAVILLEAMPLTSSGKVDRRALPAPEAGATASGHSFVAPQTPAETAIAEIWKEVLGLDRIGLQDNFFDLGGHSLLAMRAIVLIEKRLGPRLGPSDFMFHTLGQLAASCDRQSAQQKKDSEASRSMPGAIKPFMEGRR